MKKFSLVAFALLVLFAPAFSVSATDGEEERYVCFIDSIIGAGGGAGSAGGNGKDYAGNDIFTEAQIEAINANRPFYEKAVEGTDIPWAVLAVIHVLEHGLERSNPGDNNLSGDGSDGAFQIISSKYHANSSDYSFVGPLTDEQFQRQAKDAVSEIKSKKIGDLTDPNNIKKLFFAYNGQAKAYKDQALALGFTQEEANNGEGSPYVMNRYDAQRDPTVEPAKSGKTWGQIKVDHGSMEYPANLHYGAFTMYAAIAGTGGACSGGNGDITDTAILYSWEKGNSNVGTHNPKSEYVTAMKAVDKGELNGNGCSANWDGASCDVFVATVYRNSVDPDFPCCGTNNMLDKLLKNKKYELISDGSKRTATTADLQTGDILILKGHIMMYVVLPDGQGVNASASCGERTADHARPIYFSDNRGSYYVFRWKG